MNEDMWLKIPGLSRYEINKDTLEVRVRTKQRCLILKITNKSYCLLLDEGRKSTYSIDRLLFSATYKINPAEIGSNYIIKYDKKNGFEIFDRYEELYRIRVFKKKEFITNGDLLKEYSESIRITKMILNAYKTNDYSLVAMEVYKLKDESISFIKRRHRTADQTCLDIWERVYDNIINGIVKKEIKIFHLKSYIRKIINTYFAEKRKSMHKIISIDAEGYFKAKNKIGV